MRPQTQSRNSYAMRKSVYLLSPVDPSACLLVYVSLSFKTPSKEGDIFRRKVGNISDLARTGTNVLRSTTRNMVKLVPCTQLHLFVHCSPQWSTTHGLLLLYVLSYLAPTPLPFNQCAQSVHAVVHSPTTTQSFLSKRFNGSCQPQYSSRCSE